MVLGLSYDSISKRSKNGFFLLLKKKKKKKKKSIYLFICLFIHLFIIYLFIYYLFIYLFIYYLFIHLLFIYLYINYYYYYYYYYLLLLLLLLLLIFFFRGYFVLMCTPLKCHHRLLRPNVIPHCGLNQSSMHIFSFYIHFAAKWRPIFQIHICSWWLHRN